eukprot:c110_g1_i1.p1 GENE.c110_g1_i1~~c110_g1_i1.p1  ORF type:complete len:174 (-),score=45.11 c110_g1_i1:464-985(-)
MLSAVRGAGTTTVKSATLTFSRLLHTTKTVLHNTRQELCPPKPKLFATEKNFIDGTPRVVRDANEFLRFSAAIPEIADAPAGVKHFFSPAMATKEELNKIQVAQAIDKFQRFVGDTGSPEVQIAILTCRIQQLTAHINSHKKDTHCLRGLQLMVSRRRGLIQYLRKTNINAFK